MLVVDDVDDVGQHGVLNMDGKRGSRETDREKTTVGLNLKRNKTIDLIHQIQVDNLQLPFYYYLEVQRVLEGRVGRH